MKSFGEWLHNDPTKHTPTIIERPAETAEKKALQCELEILRELVIDNSTDLQWSEKSGYTFRCCCCEYWHDLEDIEHYSPDKMYCGGSPGCCP